MMQLRAGSELQNAMRADSRSAPRTRQPPLGVPMVTPPASRCPATWGAPSQHTCARRQRASYERALRMTPDLLDQRVQLVLPKLGKGISAQVARYLCALAAWQTPEGLATVSRSQLAAELGCTERTVQRWHQQAEQLGLVARVDGGWRGRVQTVRMLCMNPFTQLERKARSAHAAARRRRQLLNRKARARRAAFAAARMGDRGISPHTLTGEGGTTAATPQSQSRTRAAAHSAAGHADTAPDSEWRQRLRTYADTRGRVKPA